MKKLLLYLVFLFTSVVVNASPDSLAIKTNLLWDAMLTPNVVLEYTTGEKQSVNMAYGYNNWKLADNKRMQNWFVMPEYRWWKRQALRGLFYGIHAFAGEYNIGGIKLPFGMWKSEQTHRYDGWAVGAGATVGYAWKLGGHWNMEAAMGVGYARLNYDKYKCEVCGEKMYKRSRDYVGPTKLALTLSYVFGTHRKSSRAYHGEPYMDAGSGLRLITDTVVKEVHDTLYVSHESTATEPIEIHHVRGVADIKFIVNNTDIDDTYMGNTRELQAIADTLRILANNPDIISMRVGIKGTASPEDTYQHNTILAQGRARAVVERLKAMVQLPANCQLTSYFEPENWEGLIAYVKNDKGLNQTQREGILRIITRTDDDPDQREADLRAAYPEEYKHLRKDCYPALRMTQYEVEVFYKTRD